LARDEWEDPIDWSDDAPTEFLMTDGRVVKGEIEIDDRFGMPIAILILGDGTVITRDDIDGHRPILTDQNI